MCIFNLETSIASVSDISDIALDFEQYLPFIQYLKKKKVLNSVWLPPRLIRLPSGASEADYHLYEGSIISPISSSYFAHPRES